MWPEFIFNKVMFCSVLISLLSGTTLQPLLLTGSIVLGLRTSDGLACLPDTDLDGGSPTCLPTLEGGVLEPLEPAEPKEVALFELLALPE